MIKFVNRSLIFDINQFVNIGVLEIGDMYQGQVVYLTVTEGDRQMFVGCIKSKGKTVPNQYLIHSL